MVCIIIINIIITQYNSIYDVCDQHHQERIDLNYDETVKTLPCPNFNTGIRRNKSSKGKQKSKLEKRWIDIHFL